MVEPPPCVVVATTARRSSQGFGRSKHQLAPATEWEVFTWILQCLWTEAPTGGKPCFNVLDAIGMGSRRRITQWFFTGKQKTVLKRHQRHLTPSSLSKALKDLRLRYGYLDEDLPAVILRGSGESAQVLSYAAVGARKPSDFPAVSGVQLCRPLEVIDGCEVFENEYYCWEPGKHSLLTYGRWVMTRSRKGFIQAQNADLVVYGCKAKTELPSFRASKIVGPRHEHLSEHTLRLVQHVEEVSGRPLAHMTVEYGYEMLGENKMPVIVYVKEVRLLAPPATDHQPSSPQRPSFATRGAFFSTRTPSPPCTHSLLTSPPRPLQPSTKTPRSPSRPLNCPRGSHRDKGLEPDDISVYSGGLTHRSGSSVSDGWSAGVSSSSSTGSAKALQNLVQAMRYARAQQEGTAGDVPAAGNIQKDAVGRSGDGDGGAVGCGAATGAKPRFMGQTESSCKKTVHGWEALVPDDQDVTANNARNRGRRRQGSPARSADGMLMKKPGLMEFVTSKLQLVKDGVARCRGDYCTHITSTRPTTLDKTRDTATVPVKSILLARIEADSLDDEHEFELVKLPGSRDENFTSRDALHEHVQQRYRRLICLHTRVGIKAWTDRTAYVYGTSASSGMTRVGFSSLEAAELQVFYSRALAAVHPALYYRTVPVCGYCHRVYTALDTTRTRMCVAAASPCASRRGLGGGRSSSALVLDDGAEHDAGQHLEATKVLNQASVAQEKRHCSAAKENTQHLANTHSSIPVSSRSMPSTSTPSRRTPSSRLAATPQRVRASMTTPTRSRPRTASANIIQHAGTPTRHTAPSPSRPRKRKGQGSTPKLHDRAPVVPLPPDLIPCSLPAHTSPQRHAAPTAAGTVSVSRRLADLFSRGSVASDGASTIASVEEEEVVVARPSRSAAQLRMTREVVQRRYREFQTLLRGGTVPVPALTEGAPLSPEPAPPLLPPPPEGVPLTQSVIPPALKVEVESITPAAEVEVCPAGAVEQDVATPKSLHMARCILDNKFRAFETFLEGQVPEAELSTLDADEHDIGFVTESAAVMPVLSSPHADACSF